MLEHPLSRESSNRWNEDVELYRKRGIEAFLGNGKVMKAQKLLTICLVAAVLGIAVGNASADLVIFSDSSGLSATADFSLIDSDELKIVLTNTSTGMPAGFDNSDQLLTGISFDLGGLEIIGGNVIIGPDAADMSINFDAGQFGQGDDVSSEWGYGNNVTTTGMLVNMVSVNTSQMTAFSPGPNLDGPENLGGPQGGLLANPGIVDLGGLGAIQNSVVITLSLNSDLSGLGFLENGVIVEYGSDAAFIPEPTTVALLVLGSISLIRRKSTV